MGKTILFNEKNRGFTQFFPVLPKQRFTLGEILDKTQVPTLHMARSFMTALIDTRISCHSGGQLIPMAF